MLVYWEFAEILKLKTLDLTFLYKLFTDIFFTVFNSEYFTPVFDIYNDQLVHLGDLKLF